MQSESESTLNGGISGENSLSLALDPSLSLRSMGYLSVTESEGV